MQTLARHFLDRLRVRFPITIPEKIIKGAWSEVVVVQVLEALLPLAEGSRLPRWGHSERREFDTVDYVIFLRPQA